MALEYKLAVRSSVSSLKIALFGRLPLLSKSHESELRALGYYVLIFKYSESDLCENTRVVVLIHIETSQLIEPYITWVSWKWLKEI